MTLRLPADDPEIGLCTHYRVLIPLYYLAHRGASSGGVPKDEAGCGAWVRGQECDPRTRAAPDARKQVYAVCANANCFAAGHYEPAARS